MVPTNYYLLLSAIIFIIGAVGVLSRRNALIIFMCVEMMLNSVNLSLIALSRQWDNLNGQLFVFLIMAVAAAGDFSVRSGPGWPLTTSKANCHSSVSLSSRASGSTGSSGPCSRSSVPAKAW